MRKRDLGQSWRLALCLVLGSACDVAHERAVDTVALSDSSLRADSAVRRFVAEPAGAGAPAIAVSDFAYLRGRRLIIPVAGVHAADLLNTFEEARFSGARRHDAIDIPALRGTPVLSVDAGLVARIDTSDRGGLSLYATDPSGGYVYYYAHLDRYHHTVRDGKALQRGDTIGYVGTTGNAPPNTPHLHFAISVLGESRRWWDGAPINPWPLLVPVP